VFTTYPVGNRYWIRASPPFSDAVVLALAAVAVVMTKAFALVIEVGL